MGSINKTFIEAGFCEVDQNNVHIEIGYLSIPKVNNNSKSQEYCKINNKCWYLNKGKCNLGNECKIFKNAPNIRTER